MSTMSVRPGGGGEGGREGGREGGKGKLETILQLYSTKLEIKVGHTGHDFRYKLYIGLPNLALLTKMKTFEQSKILVHISTV